MVALRQVCVRAVVAAGQVQIARLDQSRLTRNVPDGALSGYFYMMPGNVGMETFYWDEPNDPPGVAERIEAASRPRC